MKISDIEVALVHHVGDDLDVVNAARVSFDKDSQWVDEFGKPVPIADANVLMDTGGEVYLADKDAKLINYLAKHKHHSPFNHSFLSFRIKAPIFVARQLVKHRFMPWNEVSRRYVDSEPEFYFPGNGNWRYKADNVKQGSGMGGAALFHEEGQEDLFADYDNKYDPDLHAALLAEEVLSLYQLMIKGGVCPEQARMVLPQNTMTEWRWSGTLGAFLDMLVLRLDSHTQVETRIVAEMIAVIVKELFPVSYAAYLGD